MLSYWSYILVGSDKTGKSTFQRKLVKYLCDRELNRLKKNTTHTIKRKNFPSTYRYLFTMNRSFQEVKEYETIQNYFRQHFDEADICILSAHPDIDIVEEMIYQLHKHYYNVGGIFWRNCRNRYTDEISAKLPWDERIWFYNPHTNNINKREKQINSLAQEFADHLRKRSLINN